MPPPAPATEATAPSPLPNGGAFVRDPDLAKVRSVLVQQILGASSELGDEAYVAQNDRRRLRVGDDQTIEDLENTLSRERFLIDQHSRRMICEGSSPSECRDLMETNFAEDAVYGYCSTMLDFQGCTTGAVTGAEGLWKGQGSPEEKRAVALARRGLQTR